MTCNHNNLVFV